MRLYVGDTKPSSHKAIQSALDYVGLLDRLSRSPKIFVKPNLTFPRHTPGVTTSPDFLREVLLVLSEAGAETFVGESNGGYGSFVAQEAFHGHRLVQICRETKTDLVNLSAIESKDYAATVEGKATSVRLPRFLVEDVDLTLSVPVLKVHAMTTVSLSVKNLWGCVPIDLRLLQHAQLARKLRLIVDLIKARFGIIDATYGLDNHGPMEGDARYLGKLIAGDDLYGMDWIAAGMMGFSPAGIQHLRMISDSTLAHVREDQFTSNIDVSGINWRFGIGLDVIDAFSLVCFHSDILAKIVFDSPLTRPIYAVFGRTPRRKLH